VALPAPSIPGHWRPSARASPPGAKRHLSGRRQKWVARNVLRSCLLSRMDVKTARHESDGVIGQELLFAMTVESEVTHPASRRLRPPQRRTRSHVCLVECMRTPVRFVGAMRRRKEPYARARATTRSSGMQAECYKRRCFARWATLAQCP
jgi:hypothetical protein